MNKLIAILIGLLSISFNIKAHEVDKAYFIIRSDMDSIRIFSELPWTFRNALLKDYEEDSLSYFQHYKKKHIEYQEKMFYYIRKNLFLIDMNGDTVYVSSVRKGQKKPHSHGGEVDFIFPLTKYNVVHNSLMLNFDSTHINAHLIRIGKEELKFSTKKNEVAYQFLDEEDLEQPKEAKPQKSNLILWLIIGACFLLLGAFFLFKKKK